MSDPTTHQAAVAKTLSWARAAADRGDHADALAWMATLEAIGHQLSVEDERMRESWRCTLAANVAVHRRQAPWPSAGDPPDQPTELEHAAN